MVGLFYSWLASGLVVVAAAVAVAVAVAIAIMLSLLVGWAGWMGV